MQLYPFTFQPIFKERVWGGRKLQTLYRKNLPPNVPIGESWEISDRPGDVSVITNGSLSGKSLHWLMERYPTDLLGTISHRSERFPLLVKILDAKETLSLQVHPPEQKARALNGEPKTELWYVAQAEPDAELFVGLKRGVTRPQFELKIRAGTVAECFHQISVNSGDAMFLPSGRVHALGAGLVIFEFQQNSDTTYRVFDWNRAGLDGKPRELHLEQSLESIDFQDFEPGLVSPGVFTEGPVRKRRLVQNPLFSAEAIELSGEETLRIPSGRASILGLVTGSLRVSHSNSLISLQPGGFCLVPAALKGVSLRASMDSSLLIVNPG